MSRMENFKKQGTWIFLLFFLAGAWALLYAEHFPILLKHWNTEDYSYCYLVPFLAGYLAWRVREKVKDLAGGSAVPGYLGLALAGLVFLAGRLGSLETLVYFSMWLTVASVIVLFLGIRSIKALSFPFFVLLFAIPAPPFITRLISFNLRLISSSISVKMLHFFSIPAFREGNIIDLGVTQLQVVDACSGLRYLLPTVLVALVVGSFFNRSFWERAVLFLLSAPISVLVNSLRIVVVAFLARYVSTSLAQEGFFHDFTGWLIFFISVGLVLLVSLFLRRISGGSKSPGRAAALSGGKIKGVSGARAVGKTWVHGVVVCLVFVGLYFSQSHLVSAQTPPARKDFTDFPRSINGWRGKRAYLDQAILNSLWADDYVTGSFQNPDTGNVLHLLVSYYRTQTTQHTAHAPTSCLLGGGWALEGKRLLLSNPDTGRDFPVRQMLLEKRGQRLISNFWFQQRGRVITSEYMNKAYLIWDSLTRRRTDGALVRVEMYLLPNQSVEQGQLILDEFLVELKEILKSYVPGVDT